MIIFQLVVVLGLLPSSSLEHTYYVKASGSSLPDCPGVETCLTLDQYASQQDEYFTTNSTFVFLPGNHSTHTMIHLRNVANVHLRGTEPALCKTAMTIQCEHVTNFTIQSMTVTVTFTGNGGNDFALGVLNCNRISILEIDFITHLTSAVSINHANITIENCLFERNTGLDGGAVHISNRSNVTMNGIHFVRNIAQHRGGAICVIQSNLWIDKNSSFVSNSAAEAGGIFCELSQLTILSTDFVSNSAQIGGAMCFSQVNASCYNTTFTGNSGSAAFILRSNVSFVGSTRMIENRNENEIFGVGGAILAEASSVSFTGHTLFQDNLAAVEGGAMAGLVQVVFSFSGVTIFLSNIAHLEGGAAILGTTHTELLMSGSVLFKSNNCTTCYGGAISLARNSRIIIVNKVTFESNWAEMGGAIYLRDSRILLKRHAMLVTLHNEARVYGGAIFHMDNIVYSQCKFSMMHIPNQQALAIMLPDCFLELENFSFSDGRDSPSYAIHSYNDSAGWDGQFLYGGLMDKCAVVDTQESQIQADVLYNVVMNYHILHIKPNNTDNNLISSEAYMLCFCGRSNDRDSGCFGTKSVSIHRGGRFNVSVVALSHGNTITAPVLLAEISKTSRLGLNQNVQNLSSNCTMLSYNMYSTEELDRLVLYPNKSCRDMGLAVAVVEVTFLPCPHGFIKLKDHCVCEKRLQKYNAECTVYHDASYITRKAGSKFWVGYSNESDQPGLILYQSCPIDYCKTVDVNISLSHLDSQCDFNHSRMLCGACGTNHSLMLGNAKCKKCSNVHLLLLLAFAAAGLLLVVFLSVLRLTVASGMINSLILYANIVQANKRFFFPNSSHNVLTVFIAWMNLDLGVSTCFYHGMDSYALTWLQFVFPTYVWVIMSLVIITSRYSTRMTKLIGSNPIAVLATLLLMSYTKVLKTIIQIYSSVQLNYPNTTVTVWLKDANEPYLKSRHLVLAVVSSMFIAVFFLPYTVFLLLGYKLYRYSGKRYLHWFMIRMKPLLDSYYAPYKKNTRYWTGLLLLLRCVLYIIFSIDSIGSKDNSLLAIVTSFTILIVIAWLSVRIYKDFYANAIEAFVFLNLIVLSAATSNNANSPTLVYSLVGIVFLIMIGIVFYQIHFLYVFKSALWLKITSKLARVARKLRGKPDPERTPLVPPVREVTKSFIDLREELLADNAIN